VLDSAAAGIDVGIFIAAHFAHGPVEHSGRAVIDAAAGAVIVRYRDRVHVEGAGVVHSAGSGISTDHLAGRDDNPVQRERCASVYMNASATSEGVISIADGYVRNIRIGTLPACEDCLEHSVERTAVDDRRKRSSSDDGKRAAESGDIEVTGGSRILACPGNGQGIGTCR